MKAIYLIAFLCDYGTSRLPAIVKLGHKKKEFINTFLFKVHVRSYS